MLQICRPAVLVGSSIGASTVVDFALHHPEAVAKLILMGPAAWNEGLGLFPWLPQWAAILGTKVPFSQPLACLFVLLLHTHSNPALSNTHPVMH